MDSSTVRQANISNGSRSAVTVHLTSETLWSSNASFQRFVSLDTHSTTQYSRPSTCLPLNSSPHLPPPLPTLPTSYLSRTQALTHGSIHLGNLQIPIPEYLRRDILDVRRAVTALVSNRDQVHTIHSSYPTRYIIADTP